MTTVKLILLYKTSLSTVTTRGHELLLSHRFACGCSVRAPFKDSHSGGTSRSRISNMRDRREGSDIEIMLLKAIGTEKYTASCESVN